MLFFYNLLLSSLLTIIPFYLINQDKEKFFLNLLYIFHLIFFLINIYYKDYFSSDVNGYVKWANERSYAFSLGNGTSTIVLLLQNIKLLKINLINIHLIFALIGYAGLYLFYKIINKYNDNILNKLVFFIPTWHFYTSTIGKDSLIVLLLGLCLLFFENRKIIFYFIVIAAIYLIRPNVAILFSFLLIPLIVEFLLTKYQNLLKNNFKLKISILILILTLILAVLLYVLNFQEKLIDVINFIKVRQTYHYIGYTAYDVSQLNFLEIIFYYLFMPIGINLEHNLFYLYMSLENVFLLAFFVLGISSFKIKRLKILSPEACVIFFSILFLFLVSVVNTNLGLATRQKWMIVPFFLYIFSVYSNYFNFLKK